MNRNFGKLVDGAVKYAPINLVIGGALVSNPTDAEYLAQGWLAVHAEKPTDKVGVYYIADGWEERDGAIYRKWREEPIVAPEPVNRRWTRLKIKTALAMAGMIVKAEEYLKGVDIAPNYNAWQALGDCDYVEENWPQEETWNAVLDGAAEAFGKTRAEIDAFLDSIPTEEVR